MLPYLHIQRPQVLFFSLKPPNVRPLKNSFANKALTELPLLYSRYLGSKNNPALLAKQTGNSNVSKKLWGPLKTISPMRCRQNYLCFILSTLAKQTGKSNVSKNLWNSLCLNLRALPHSRQASPLCQIAFLRVCLPRRGGRHKQGDVFILRRWRARSFYLQHQHGGQ